ncbi:MAG: hypothetical protein M3N98_07180 [Actinomycetota bacterium]|nr:hypothetical protein [Actinomycetota bacterium]
MRVVFTQVRSELRSGWRGWLIAALLVGVAGGVVLTTAAGARRTDTAYARLLASSRGADVLIAAQGEGGKQNVTEGTSYYAAVAGLPGVDLVAPVIGVVALDSGNGNTAVNLQAGTDARMGRDIERPKITHGRMFDPAHSDEAVADWFLARRLHLHVGSVVHLLAGPKSPAGFDFAHAISLTVRVVGVGVTRDNVVPVNAAASLGILRVTPALVRELSPDLYTYHGEFVRLSKRTSVAAFGRQAQALVTQFPETGGQLGVAAEHQQAAKVIRAIRPEAAALAVFALLVALTSLLIIGQILARQVFIASADHPTLRALGFRPAQLAAIGLAEIGVTVAVGASLAVVFATALSPLMPIGPARLAEPHPGVAVNWAILGLGALSIVVIFVLRLAPTLWRLAGRPIGHEGAMSAGRVKRPSRTVKILTQTGAPVSTVVGARLALEPGRGRTAVPVRSTLAGTAVAVAAVATAFTFGTNLVRLVNTPRLYGQIWQVSVDAQFATISQNNVGMFLRQQRGVSGWTLGTHGEATMAGRHVTTVNITEAEGPAMFPLVPEGRTPKAPDEIVLGAKTMADAHRHVGDTVIVSLQGENTLRTMRVVGRAVFPFFGQTEFTPTGLGDGAALLDPGPNPDGFNFVLIAMAPGPAQRDNIARLARNLKARNLKATRLCSGHQECVAVTAQRPADVNNYAQIKTTPMALAGVLALLAVATVAHLLVTSIRRRRRDLAVLKTLGFFSRQVSAAVAWQATIVVAFALLVGLPAGVAAGRFAWLFFAGRLGVALDAEVPLLPVLLSIPAALAIANAVAAGPGWVAGRVQPALVLRTE